MTFGAKKRQRLAKLAVAVSSTAATLIALPGCDDPHQVDRRVRESVQQARLARAKSGPDGFEQSQKLLKEAAAEANAAVSTQAHAKAMLAQAQYDAALASIADPKAGVDVGNGEILRLIREINQLGQQINASNGLVAVYRQMDPKEARAAVEQRILEATGDASKPTWIGEGEGAVPTLTAVQQQVEQQQAAVSKQQELIKGLQVKQEQVTAQAAQVSSQADAARGRAGLDLFKQGVGLRKQAADIGTQIDVEQSRLAQLEHGLKLAQARQQAVSTAIQQFQEAGKNVEAGWKGVEAQAAAQQQLAKTILQGGGKSEAAQSIADKAKALRAQLEQNDKKFEDAKQNLTEAIKNYEQAAAAATKLRGEISPREQGLPADNQMKVALKTMMEVFHPGTYEVGQAASQLALANLQVSRAQTLNERARLLDSLSKVLSGAGLAMPQELNDPALPELIKKTAQEANDNYTAAMELYSKASDGGGGDAVKKGSQSGKIYVLYGQALLARASGGDAKEQLAAAVSARDTVLADSPGALSALPAELVPPPSTQPAAATGAATTPATAPADGTVPDGTVPADGTTAPATTPAEGTTPPADGAAPATTPAPAEGTTPPADGAAPATPPADGAAPAAPAEPAAPATPPAAETPAAAPQ